LGIGGGTAPGTMTGAGSCEAGSCEAGREAGSAIRPLLIDGKFFAELLDQVTRGPPVEADAWDAADAVTTGTPAARSLLNMVLKAAR